MIKVDEFPYLIACKQLQLFFFGMSGHLWLPKGSSLFPAELPGYELIPLEPKKGVKTKSATLLEHIKVMIPITSATLTGKQMDKSTNLQLLVHVPTPYLRHCISGREKIAFYASGLPLVKVGSYPPGLQFKKQPQNSN